MEARRSFEQVFNRITDAARRWAEKLRQKPTEAVVPPVRLLAKPEPIPADPAEHAVQFAEDWYDRLEFYARQRMRELEIPEPRIGAYDIDYGFRHAAFFPKERSGGANSPGTRINLNSGILNPELLGPKLGSVVTRLWAKGRLRDRIDAVIAHEDIEGAATGRGRRAEDRACTRRRRAPDSSRPIREGARHILRAIREHEQRKERGV